VSADTCARCGRSAVKCCSTLVTVKVPGQDERELRWCLYCCGELQAALERAREVREGPEELPF
jgi:hypothetical protein